MPESANNPPGSPNSMPERCSKPKNAKPSFDVFVKSLLELVDSASNRDVLPKVLELLKKGFIEEVRPEHVDKVLAILISYQALDRLGVRLIMERPQRSRQILVALLNRLRTQFAGDLGYPTNISQDGDRLVDLLQWSKVGDKKRLPAAPRYPDVWVRKAIVCLSLESDPNIAAGVIHRLLYKVAGGTKRSEGEVFHTDYRSYLREVGRLISLNRIGPQSIASALQFCHPYEEQVKHDRQQFEEYRQETASALQKARDLAEENAHNIEELRIIRGREATLRQQFDQTQSQLRLEIDRKEELIEHSQRELEQRLASQRHSLAAAFKHDLQEARLGLDRSGPNVEMALNRIRQMEEVLRKLEQGI